jgi:hypothetical protein
MVSEVLRQLARVAVCIPTTGRIPGKAQFVEELDPLWP